MFRMLGSTRLKNNLSDEQVEYQVRDRLRLALLGLAIEDSIPDATSFGVPREAGQGGMIEKLFDRFHQHLRPRAPWRGAADHRRQYRAVPTQRNSRDENASCRLGAHSGVEAEARQSAEKDPRCALDQEAWPHFFGYKNHVNADASTS